MVFAAIGRSAADRRQDVAEKKLYGPVLIGSGLGVAQDDPHHVVLRNDEDKLAAASSRRVDILLAVPLRVRGENSPGIAVSGWPSSFLNQNIFSIPSGFKRKRASYASACIPVRFLSMLDSRMTPPLS